MSDGGVGQRSKPNLRNKFPTREAKLEITSYYYFWEREQMKNKQKSRKLKFKPKSINPTKKPKERNPKQGIMSTRAVQALSAGRAGEGALPWCPLIL